jgi:DtxR family Mn-dependent transcriptional regulator
MPVRDPQISSAVEDYAKAIYALEALGPGTVTTTAIAERMGVTAASASGMVRKLCELDLTSRTRASSSRPRARASRSR